MQILQRLRSTFAAKKLIFGSQCNEIIVKTAAEVARIAAITLGPRGRNVVIENGQKEPRITKDGVTVVKHIEYEDRLQDAVCTLIKKSVNSTNRFAGDGTTTSALLIGQILKEGRKALEVGVSAKQLKDGLVIGRDLGIEFIKMAAKKIQTKEQFYKVAMIATKNDELLSDLISQAIMKSSIIKVQKAQMAKSYVEVTQYLMKYYSGVKMVAGIPHPQFKNVGDRVELDYPLVLLDKKGIKSIEQIIGVLELAQKARKPLFLVSSSLSDSVLSTLIYNRRKNIVEVFPLILNNYGTIVQQYYELLAKTTQATIFGEYGPKIQQVQFKHLGQAVRVEMDQIETSVIGKSKQSISNAVIYAGGSTEAITLQIYDKLIDALNSVKTSKKHGVVAGGGITYWRLADLLQKYQGLGKQGVRILARALRAPRKKLVEGLPEEYKALGGLGWQAFNFKTRRVEDMFSAGILDSAIVGQSVLVDSVSLSQMLLDISVCVMRNSLNNESNQDINRIQESLKI